MRRRRFILAIVILFIAINSLLVYFDGEKEVVRTSYIEKWSETFKKDLYVKMETAGVLATVNEKNVYFDEDRGSFLEFLVEKGSAINAGDGLFTYEVRDYDETKSYLESEQSKLNGQISAIEKAISSISFYQIPETDLSAEFENEENVLEITSQSVDANYMKEQYLVEKGNELAQKNAQLQSIQAQLSKLETTGNTITVESPYQGEVTGISEALNNPIITIRDMELQAEGELTEAERMKVKKQMPVEITISNNGDVFKGSLKEISDSPKEVNVHGISIYSFQVGFEEGAEIEGLLPGYHSELAITTNQALKATTVMEDHVFDQSLWKMTTEGKLHKQKIETGIHVDDKYEIVNGAAPGDWIAVEEESQFRQAATFITPLELDDIQWKRLGNYDNVSWKKYFVIGLLSR